MNPGSYPYLRLLIPFACGLALGGAFDKPIPGSEAMLLAGMFAIFALAFRRFDYRYRWVFGTTLFCWCLLAGYYHIVSYNECRRPDHFSTCIDGVTWIVGQVYEAPSKGARLKIPVRVEYAGASPDSMQSTSGNLLILLDTTVKEGTIHYGDRITAHLRINPTDPPKNPHAFDYQRYLHFQNIHYQAFAKSDVVQVLSSGHGQVLWRYAYACRDQLLESLSRYFPTRGEYAVAAALLVGYQADLPDDLKMAYAATGSMHALAVSGSHVGMLYTGLLVILKRFRFRGKWGRLIETALILSVIWAFTLLTGATASVLRASVMFTVYMIGKAIHRDASAWNVLALSALILLLFNPYLLYDAGFQLSYAAVAGMVFFYPRFYRNTPVLPAWADPAWQVLLVGFAAQIGTLPLSLFYFHQFPVYFWLAGWVVILGGAIFLWGGAILIAADYTWHFMAEWLGLGLYYMLWGMNKIIFFIQQLPGSVVDGIWLDNQGVFLLYCAIFFAGAAMLDRAGKWILLCLSALLLLGLARVVMTIDNLTRSEMVVYDVAKHTLADFFDGNRLITFSDSLKPKQVLFAAQPNRCAHGVIGQSQLDAPADTVFTTPNLLCDPPFMQFFQHRIVLISPALDMKTAYKHPVPVDVLLFSGNPDVDIDACYQQFPCRLAVFDSSNNWKHVEKWKLTCQALHLPYWDVRTQGAWIQTASGRY
jgi:competence protein ComEC